jgi:hypothetical protein
MHDLHVSNNTNFKIHTDQMIPKSDTACYAVIMRFNISSTDTHTGTHTDTHKNIAEAMTLIQATAV